MYKVFVNEKKLTLSKLPIQAEKSMVYEAASTLEIAMDLLENTSCCEVNVYSESLDEMWRCYKGLFNQIEAAGGIVQNSKGEYLFIFRLGKWDLPKGKIEKEESIPLAAVREIEEETGLTGMILGETIELTYHIYTERNGKKNMKTTYWYKMEYLGNETPVPQIEEGITQVAWKTVSEICDEVFKNTFKNIRLVVKAAGVEVPK